MNEGFLGGTFDPPHLGHLVLAQEALELFKLERVHFIPSRNPPHKGGRSVSPFSVRMEMLHLALSGNDRFSVLDVEPADGPSFTVNLVETLVGMFEGKPWLILGLDSLVEMPLWREPLSILRRARVVVGTRPGFAPSEVDPAYLSEVRLFQFPGVYVSSSAIRRRVQEGRSIRYLVTDGVSAYIREKGLYGPGKGDRPDS